MNGYLMQDQPLIKGQENFIESFSPENRYGVVFEDDGETGYFYAVEKDAEGGGLRILDALHIYEADEQQPAEHEEVQPSKLLIVWSRDWTKCALVIDGFCQALFDFVSHGGYNINEFPPPNDIWTKGTRQLTNELISTFF